MKSIIKTVVRFIRKLVVVNFFLKNSDFYIDKNQYFLGSLCFYRNFILNMLYPGRFFFKLRYKQVFKKENNSVKYFEKKHKVLLDYYPNYFNNNKIDQLRNCLTNLNNDGAFIIKNYFSKNYIDIIKKKYFQEISDLKSINNKKEISYNHKLLKMDELTKSLFFDPSIILVIESFFQREVYARNYPVINYTSVPKILNNNTISKVADNWHVDHVNIGSLFLFIEDVDINGTRMQYLPGSHKYHHTGFQHSYKQYEHMKKIECYGPQGTIHFHYGNTVHRAKTIPGFNRWSLNFEYSIGSNILLNPMTIAKTLSDEFDLTNETNLNNLEKKFFNGIYPNVLSKGYEVINNKFIPTRYSGI